MEKYKYIIIVLVTMCLFSCDWIRDDGGHKYITIFNASDSMVICSIQPTTERNCLVSIFLQYNDTLKPHSSSLVYYDEFREQSWESGVAYGKFYLQISFIGYNTYKTLIKHPGARFIDDKDLLYHKDYSLQDLNNCNFFILYPMNDSVSSK